LVIARKRLVNATYGDFANMYHVASIRLVGRNETMSAVVAQFLEHDLELLGLTGVEDKLEDDVKSTLELLRNAGVKIWMLTGDKVDCSLYCDFHQVGCEESILYIHEMFVLSCLSVFLF
jgi:phospholipid-translocating ATPase